MGFRGTGAYAAIRMENPANRIPEDWEEESLPMAERMALFIEKTKLTAGQFAGQFRKLRPFQRLMVDGIYREAEGRRPVRTALATMGRKNGKTDFAVALAAGHLFGPAAEPRGEVYSAASDRNQAARVFRELEAMIVADPKLRRRCNIQRFAKKIEVLSGPGEGSIYEALSSDARKAHSLSPSFVVCDELPQWKSRELYDNLVTGTGAREQPLIVVIATMSDDPNNIMSELVHYGRQVNEGEINDPSFFAQIFSVPMDMDIWEESTWHLANPALGDFRSLEEMRKFAEQARKIPGRENTFRLLYLNQPVSATFEPLITKEQWQACRSTERQLVKPRESIYLGLDLSGVLDLTALIACSAENGDRLKGWFWKPGDLLKEHGDRDRVPYPQWVQDGWIEAPKGNVIDYGFVARRIGQISEDYKILGLAFDRWNMKNLRREMEAQGIQTWIEGSDKPLFHGIRLIPWAQSWSDMTPAVDALHISILNETLQHDGNPVLAFNFANAKAISDAAGNRKLDKSATRFRIDGAVAAAMAIGLKARQLERKKEEFQAFFV